MGFSGIRRLKTVALAAFLSACGQLSTGPTLLPAVPERAAQSLPVSVTIRIPNRTGIAPKYVSPATKSASVVVTPVGGTALPAVVFNCGAEGCSGIVGAPAGDDSFAISLYDRRGAKGKQLAAGSQTKRIFAGRANTVKAVLGGVPASVLLSVNPPRYDYLSAGKIVIRVVASDADGYTIVGPYTKTITISSSNKSSHSWVSGTKIASSKESVKLSYDAAFTGSTISARSAGIAKAKWSILPNLVDDWTTFAHDTSRTGHETLPTGIGKWTVSNLEKAWVVSPDNGACTKIALRSGPVFTDEAAPVVWGGLVFYANTCGAVYALAREDGHTVWKTQLPLTSGDPTSGVWGTPALDVSKNSATLVVPVWGTGGTSCPGTSCVPAHGGYVAALNAATGTVEWKTAPLAAGQMRGEPLALNGIVYQGVSGGDPDTGYVQGGMMAIDESTGARTGFFQVAKPGDVDDGGASWSPISYDGTSIYFGTGNTLNNDGDFDGVVKLNPATMSPIASYGTYKGSDDEDVGGGELLYGGNMYFSGKNGYYYGFSLSSFAATPLFSRLINKNSPPGGEGGIGTPTTDGNVISVSSGYNNINPVQSDLDLFPVGSGTKRCTVKPVSATPSSTANSAIFSSAAWVNGVGFLGLDNGKNPGTKPEVYGFDDNCNIVWTANDLDIYGFFYAGPAVVQSGLYAVDNVGNVYSWKLPATMGIDALGRRIPAQRTNAPVRFFLNKQRHYFPNEHGEAHAR